MNGPSPRSSFAEPEFSVRRSRSTSRWRNQARPSFWSWIHDIEQRLDVDPDKATTVLGRCLGVIRDSLTVDEAADLAAQLPIVIHGRYYHEWKPSRTPVQRSRTDAL